MLAASQEHPGRCASRPALQKHPYAFFSLKKKPVRERQGPGRQEGRHPGDRHHPAARAAGEEQDRREGRRDRHDRRRHDAAADRPGRRGDRLAHQHHGAEGARRRPRRPAAVGHRREALRAALLRHHRTRSRRRPTCCRPSCAPSRKGWAYAPQESATRRSRSWSRSIPTSTRADEREALDVMLTYAFNADDPGRRLGHDGPGGLAGADRRSTPSWASSRKRTPKLEEVMTARDPQDDRQTAAPKIG